MGNIGNGVGGNGCVVTFAESPAAETEVAAKKLQMITLRVPSDLHEQIKVIAKSRKQSMNEFCIATVKDWIDRLEVIV